MRCGRRIGERNRTRRGSVGSARECVICEGAWDRRGSYDYSAVECQCIEYPVVAHSLLIQGVIRDASHVGEVELGSRLMCRRGSTQRRWGEMASLSWDD